MSQMYVKWGKCEESELKWTKCEENKLNVAKWRKYMSLKSLITIYFWTSMIAVSAAIKYHFVEPHILFSLKTASVHVALVPD